MILVIDNYDSFTYNLVQQLGELGCDVRVFRNDKKNLNRVKRIDPSHVVISPGPCTPKESGISKDVIRYFTGKLPLLGVCLGHQAIAEVFGGEVILADKPVHGKTSEIFHNNKDIFKRLKKPFIATRYHSLIVNKNLPDCLELTAWNKESIVMGMKHKDYDIFGVQFHPESFLTTEGKKLIKNFIKF